VVILWLGGLLVVTLWGQLEALGPWIVATISIIAVGLANYWRFKSNRWKKIDLFKRRAVGVPVETEAVVE
jgi:Na+-driven multidrug efflux pump